MARRILLAVLAAWGVSGTVLADGGRGWPWSQLQIHGFASVTGLKTSANRFYGNSPGVSLKFIELGLNASYQMNPRVLFSAQVLSRTAGDMADGTPMLDYGLMDLTLSETSAHRFGVRIGRFKNPLGLYNETRDVPFTRPTIFLPQVVYFDKVRNMLLSSDGALFHGDLYTGFGDVSFHFGVGQSVYDRALEWTLVGGDWPGKLRPSGASWLGGLWFASPGERLRLGLSLLQSPWTYRPGSAVDLEVGRVDIRYAIASFQYNTERWTLTSEYGRMPLRWEGFGALFPYRKMTGEGWYVQGAYRVRPNLELTLRYEHGTGDRTDPSGERSSALTGGVVPPFDFLSRAWVVGLRWNLNRHLMLQANYGSHRGTFTLSQQENNPANLVKDWDLVAVQIAVRF